MFDSQAKGKRAERDVADYLTSCGLAARRHVRTGTATVHDEGDIRIPGITFEVKHWDGGLTYGTVNTLLRKLELQRGDGQLGVLVERVDSIAAHRAAEWNAWLRFGTLLELLCYTGPLSNANQAAPTLLKLGEFVGLWKATGRAQLTNPFELAQ
jgi:hypothetical protein